MSPAKLIAGGFALGDSDVLIFFGCAIMFPIRDEKQIT
jgi:hypothetical protein